jgi:hypothetical protein
MAVWRSQSEGSIGGVRPKLWALSMHDNASVRDRLTLDCSREAQDRIALPKRDRSAPERTPRCRP